MTLELPDAEPLTQAEVQFLHGFMQEHTDVSITAARRFVVMDKERGVIELSDADCGIIQTETDGLYILALTPASGV